MASGLAPRPLPRRWSRSRCRARPRRSSGIFDVDTTADGNDGECTRDCTLREAVALADVRASGRSRWAPASTGSRSARSCSRTACVDRRPWATSGPGRGARSTVIDARDGGRVVQVPAGSSSIVLAGVTLTGGNAPIGGAMLVGSGAQLCMYDSDHRGEHRPRAAAGRSNAGLAEPCRHPRPVTGGPSAARSRSRSNGQHRAHLDGERQHGDATAARSPPPAACR